MPAGASCLHTSYRKGIVQRVVARAAKCCPRSCCCVGVRADWTAEAVPAADVVIHRVLSSGRSRVMRMRLCSTAGGCTCGVSTDTPTRTGNASSNASLQGLRSVVVGTVADVGVVPTGVRWHLAVPAGPSRLHTSYRKGVVQRVVARAAKCCPRSCCWCRSARRLECGSRTGSRCRHPSRAVQRQIASSANATVLHGWRLHLRG